MGLESELEDPGSNFTFPERKALLHWRHLVQMSTLDWNSNAEAGAGKLTGCRQGPTLVVRGHFLETTHQEDTLKGVFCKKRSPSFINRVIEGARFTLQKFCLMASSLGDFSSTQYNVCIAYSDHLFSVQKIFLSHKAQLNKEKSENDFYKLIFKQLQSTFWLITWPTIKKK